MEKKLELTVAGVNVHASCDKGGRYFFVRLLV